MGINYAAINAKIAGKRTVLAGDGALITRWLPHGHVRAFISNMASAPGYTRDVAQYIKLWQQARQLKGTNGRVAQAILGTEIDLRNILWLYRLKKYRGVAGDEAFGKLIPVRWRLTMAWWQRMASAANGTALLDAIASSPYGGVFSSFTQPERALDAAVARMCGIEAKRNPNSIAGLCGFILRVPASPYLVPAW